MQDINVYSEAFIGKLLNLLWETALVDLNAEEDQNYPSVDLGDRGQQLFVQVTSTVKRKKIDKTITSFEEYHKAGQFTKLRIVVLRQKGQKYQKPFTTNGEYDFDVKTSIISLGDIYNQIRKLSIDRQRSVRDFLVEQIPMSSNKNDISQETYLLRSLFDSVASSGVTLPDSVLEAVEESELTKKQEKYEAFWEEIKFQYNNVFSETRERAFKNVFDNFDQAGREKLKQYLRYHSTRIISDEDDPLSAIDTLKNYIRADINMPLVSEVDVLHLLYYQFYRCNVFPIGVGNAN